MALAAGNGLMLSLLVITAHVTLGALSHSQRQLYFPFLVRAVLACLGWMHLLLPYTAGVRLKAALSGTSGLRQMARLLSTVTAPAWQLVAKSWHGFVGLTPVQLDSLPLSQLHMPVCCSWQHWLPFRAKHPKLMCRS